ncbi:hypothetical protein GCM10007989_04830 [Devosia pacifica]|uniref:Tail assembly chaperone E/41/14-like protein n=1 Tax=Devosia pacifica TaxID=1335967 RepID=A0A918VNW0_9HYPH|nr:phage tail assembly protein [Devosia pacifica]GHA13279.1 hypothetical protein GCM10007989_04830 [Devosia pacifica]
MTETRPTSATVPLSEPVTYDGVTYTELTFRRMKARDTLVGEGETNEVMAGYKMFAALADVPVEVILELDMEDISEVGAKVAPLMGKRAAAALEVAMEKSPSPGET